MLPAKISTPRRVFGTKCSASFFPISTIRADLSSRNAPVRFREDLRSRMPEPSESEQLGLPTGTPVVDIARTAYTESGRIVEVNEMTADSAAYIFRYDFNG